MRVTILIDDNAVYVDGLYAPVDCTALHNGEIHVVQWHGEWGEEEFRNVEEDQTITRKPNNRITDISPYQSYVDAWETSRVALVAEEEASKREIEEAKAKVQEIEARAKIDQEKNQLEFKRIKAEWAANPPETTEQM